MERGVVYTATLTTPYHLNSSTVSSNPPIAESARISIYSIVLIVETNLLLLAPPPVHAGGLASDACRKA